jgi:1-acyl-sn-glycerol-3-phosphate acyltransferase
MAAELMEIHESTYRGRFGRRAISIPIVVVLWVLTSSLLPMLIPLGLLVDLLRKDRGRNLTRLFIFLPVYCLAEVFGLWLLFFTGLFAKRGSESFLATTYKIQGGWTRFLLESIRIIFSLRFELSGQELLAPGPVVVLVTHSSIVDTLLPTALVSVPLGMRLRFVLKQELLAVPCLDVAGHRVPNCFVSRSGQNSEREIGRVAALARNLGEREGVLIYPEGTRFTEAKRSRALEKLALSDPSRAARLAGIRRVLPIQKGGTLALLEAAADSDVVIISHSGLHGTAELSDIAKTGLANRHVRVNVARFARSTLPKGSAELLQWLDERWLEADQRITNETVF